MSMSEGQTHKIKHLHSEKDSMAVKRRQILYDKRRKQNEFSGSDRLQNMVCSMLCLSEAKDEIDYAHIYA